ncbi:MAG: hypothetical protein OHK0023_09530 [Anaerolineae bacterium]
MTNRNGQITYMNPYAEAFFGVAPQEAYGKPFAMLSTPYSRVESDQVIRFVVQHELAWDGNLEFLANGRTAILMRLTASPIVDDHGQCQGVLCITINIHDSVMMQRVLQRERDLLEAILESANDGLFMVDIHRDVVAINLPFEHLFHIRRQQVLQRPLESLVDTLRIHSEIPPDLLNMLLTFGEDRTQNAGGDFSMGENNPRVIKWYSAPVYSGTGEHMGRLFVFRDVTDERVAERIKSEFVSLVSHELRTPVTAINGMAEMLLDGEYGRIDDEAYEPLGMIKSNAERLITLINDIIALSQIEAGRIELRRAKHTLEQIISDALISVRPMVLQKQQNVVLEIPDQLPSLMVDRNRLVQVMTNLLSNASKYTQPRGSILIRADTMQQGAILPPNAPPDLRLPAVLLMVQDTGIGIAEEAQSSIFERFFRAKDAHDRQIQGSGLGLAITRSLVELHGGKIWVYSAPEEGASFFFTIPILNDFNEDVS